MKEHLHLEVLRFRLAPLGYEIKLNPDSETFAFDLFLHGKLEKEKLSWRELLEVTSHAR